MYFCRSKSSSLISFSWLIIIFWMDLKQRQRGKALRLWISNVNIKRIAIPLLNYSSLRAYSHTHTNICCVPHQCVFCVCMSLFIHCIFKRLSHQSVDLLWFISFRRFPLRNANNFIRFSNIINKTKYKINMFESYDLLNARNSKSLIFFYTRSKMCNATIL